MANVNRDQNRITGAAAESSDGDNTIVPLQADPTTHRLKVEGVGGIGIINENWDSVTVAYPTTSTEVYTFTYGGLAVATVTVTYTDATKEVLTSVVRT